jgi:hypothetical protein
MIYALRLMDADKGQDGHDNDDPFDFPSELTRL